MPPLAWKNLLPSIIDANPKLIQGINVVLVLMLSYSLAQMSWRMAPEPAPLPAPPLTLSSPAVKSGNSASQGSSLVRQLPQWHLFGKVSVASAAPVREEIPETKLKLTLRGLLASDKPEESWAIIAGPSGKEEFYKIGGKKLPGNAKLTEIHSDRIVLERRGKYETLRLPKESLNLKSTTSTASRSSGTVRSMASGRHISLREYRDTLLNNPDKVADLVTIAPVRKRGRFVGYSLQPGRDPEFLRQYGLQPGDIVTSVNGVALDSPVKGFGVLRDLTSASSLEIEIERNGRRQHFSLPVN